MSTSQALTECHHCSETYEHGFDGQYCSEACKDKQQAETSLNLIRHDHRFCGTCGGQLKTIEPPNEDWKHEKGSVTETAIDNGAEYHNVDGVGLALDATECYRANPTSVESVIGFQYRTPEAITVEKEREGPDEYTRIETTGTGCVCGCTDPSNTDDVLRQANPARVLVNYLRAFRILEREGQTYKVLSKDVFFQTYKETRDFELAIGKGLHEG